MNEAGDVPYRDQIAAAIAVSDRGCGRPAVGIFHGSASPLEQAEDGTSVSALIMAARANPDERALAELLAEAERVKQAIAQKRQSHEEHLANATDALARGESIAPLTAMLLHARAVNAEREAAPPRPAPPRLEAKPDFYAGSSGSIVAAPASSDESAPPPPAPLNLSPKSGEVPKPPPFQAEPTPAPKPKPSPPPGAPYMPGHSEFLSEKATREADAVRAAKVEQARAQGRPQISREEAFPPDPRESPEVVTLGRVAGGRGIRRV